ncbi:hypothetical protein I6N90_13750 [Paenibacillus sp. GSMTC-2017]|nr:hypothetical protein [Paenibacillus sp. GSMTC-2017]
MKKSFSLIVIMLAAVLSFSTNAFAAFSVTEPSVNLSGGTIAYGYGVIVNTSVGNHHDDLTIKLYRGNTLISSTNVHLWNGAWIYPGSTTTPLIVLATGQPAGNYHVVLSASGDWNVKANLTSY